MAIKFTGRQHRDLGQLEPLRRAGATARQLCSARLRAMGSRPAHAPPIAIRPAFADATTRFSYGELAATPAKAPGASQRSVKTPRTSIDRPTCVVADARDIS